MPIGPIPLPGGAQSVSVVLNGSGNGQVSLGPQRVREHWQVTAVGVQTQPNPSNAPPAVVGVLEAQCSVYLGVPGGIQQQFFGQTFTGSSGDTCGVASEDIQTGQVLTAVWQGGDAGATATMTIFGTYTIGTP